MTSLQYLQAPQSYLAPQNLLFEESYEKQTLSLIMKNPYLKKLSDQRRISRNIRRGITTQKIINLKMRNRLIKWLQQINKETFHFSSKTLIQALQILDEYLSSTDEHFSQLQLIGCACLYMSSKINESIIVAGECYVDCSGQIFTKEQLSQKEKLIFQALDSNLNFSNPLRLMNKMRKAIGLCDLNDEKSSEFVIKCFLSGKFKGFSEFQISLATVISFEMKKQFSQQQVLTLINKELYAY